MERIGIFGGSFDPPHKEHVALAQAAVRELNLDALLVVPAYSAPHKKGHRATSAEFRYEMAKRAFAGIERVRVSDIELARQQISYTYLTVERIARLFPAAQLFLLVGGDMLADFKTWKNPERILAAATPVVAARQGDDADYAEEERYFRNRFGASFRKLRFSGEECSATKLRVYLAFGLSVGDALPAAVSDYIASHALYRGSALVERVKRALKPSRILHTANVIVCALYRARAIGVSEEKAYIACALHDCAKYLNASDYPDFVCPNGVPQPVLHAFLGAYVAEREYGITDPEILDAIRYHTTARPAMTALEKLVFVADLVEEGRDYPDAPYLRSLYLQGDFEQCFFTCLTYQYDYLKKQKKPVFSLTEKAVDYYQRRNQT